jgi:arginyl-tRNA synthetase
METGLILQLKKIIQDSLQDLGFDVRQDDILLAHPKDPAHGEYSTNIALLLAKKENKNPPNIAQALKEKLDQSSSLSVLVSKTDAVSPGFINFHLSPAYLKDKSTDLFDLKKFKSDLSSVLAGKKYLLEHTSPDPIKTIHIGHLRNNFLGLSFYHLLTLLGAKVTLDCINNDRGTHVCRAIWGYLAFAHRSREKANKQYKEEIKNYSLSDETIKNIADQLDWKILLADWVESPPAWFQPEDLNLSSDKFNNCFYSLGQRSTDLVPEVKDQIEEILKSWEEENPGLRKIWRQIIDWSLQGYEKTYQRIGSHFDHVWHESDHYQQGKTWVKKGLKKGIFKKLPDGAILSDLKKYGLTDTILIKKDGTALYHTQDLELTSRKIKKFPSDLYIWDIGNEQKLYLKQLFAMVDQLDIEKKEKLMHLNFGFITLKGGVKMSSRYGGVINADDLLDQVKEEAKKVMQSAQKIKASEDQEDFISERVALSAVKYAFLKYGREKDFSFDIKESLSVQGNSGPYLQYTYARCHSILSQSDSIPSSLSADYQPNPEEKNLLKSILQFKEVLLESADHWEISTLCTYLYHLSQDFALFYQKHRILNLEDPKTQSDRLFLTQITQNVLKLGLEILGIPVLEKM